MKHRVAVRAHWPEILDGIDHVAFGFGAQGRQVVNMNKTITKLAINLSEVKVADGASQAPPPNAGAPNTRVSLVAVDQDLRDIALNVGSLLLGRRMSRLLLKFGGGHCVDQAAA